MKKILLSMAALLVLGSSVSVDAQRHRHTPRTENVVSASSAKKDDASKSGSASKSKDIQWQWCHERFRQLRFRQRHLSVRNVRKHLCFKILGHNDFCDNYIIRYNDILNAVNNSGATYTLFGKTPQRPGAIG